MMCRRCGLEPATLDALGETGQGADYCMECWLRGSYSLVSELLEEEPKKSSDPLISKAVWQLVGGILIAVAFAAAYGWVCGSEVGALSGWHWVWILALGALGRLFQHLGRGSDLDDCDDCEWSECK